MLADLLLNLLKLILICFLIMVRFGKFQFFVFIALAMILGKSVIGILWTSREMEYIVVGVPRAAAVVMMDLLLLLSSIIFSYTGAKVLYLSSSDKIFIERASLFFFLQELQAKLKTGLVIFFLHLKLLMKCTALFCESVFAHACMLLHDVPFLNLG
jgi:hypothetical protein